MQFFDYKLAILLFLGIGNLNAEYFCAMSDIGGRSTQEDVCVCSTEPSFFYGGIFDGHGGDKVCKYLGDNLLNVILSHCQSLGQNLSDAIFASFSEIDQNISKFPNFVLPSSRKLNRTAVPTLGSTALIAFLFSKKYETTGLAENKIVIANLGDSRAVICREDGSVEQLTNDHNFKNQKEYDRVNSLDPGYIVGATIPRYCRVLAVSRSFGDFGTDSSKQRILSQPEITDYSIKSNDKFLIMASDGLWDIMSNEAVVAIARESYVRTQSVTQVCREIIRYAKSIRIQDESVILDNITVLVIDINAWLLTYNFTF